MMAIQTRMIESCQGFAEFYLSDVAPNVEIGRSRTSKRRKLVAESAPGWVLGTEVDHSDIPYEYQIVLLGTGEIFCDRGIGLLTYDEPMQDHWALPGWFEQAFERYGLRPWPSGIEDLRRLSIEFHLAANGSPATEPGATQSGATQVGVLK